MIFEVQSYALIATDILYSLSAGFVVGFIYQLLSIFLYKGKLRVFVKDILTSVLFAVVVYSFAISFTNYHILRWYNVVPALIGFIFFVPCFSKAGQLMMSFVSVTVGFFTKSLEKSFLMCLKKNFEKIFEKKQKFTKKNPDKVLKNDTQILYN